MPPPQAALDAGKDQQAAQQREARGVEVQVGRACNDGADAGDGFPTGDAKAAPMKPSSASKLSKPIKDQASACREGRQLRPPSASLVGAGRLEEQQHGDAEPHNDDRN